MIGCHCNLSPVMIRALDWLLLWPSFDGRCTEDGWQHAQNAQRNLLMWPILVSEIADVMRAVII